MTTTTSNFRETYSALLDDLFSNGHVETNARTNARISVGQPTSFDIDLSNGALPVCGIRKVYPKTAAAEIAWFLQGKKEVGFISKYAPIWNDFIEEAGPDQQPYVAAAYGYRWREHFGRDQIGDAIQALHDNPSDRRIFISAWDPEADGLGQPGKNVPCPVGFTLSLTDGKLNSTLLIRSSDVFVGLPYDTMGHALTMQAICTSLNKLREDEPYSLGVMHVSLAHPHVYHVHAEMAGMALSGTPSDQTILMPKDWGVTRIANFPDAYVEHVADLYKAVEVKPEYSCRPEIVV